ncbi:hypothetical protein Tco_1242860, partial [Tanacetum coccineum]
MVVRSVEMVGWSRLRDEDDGKVVAVGWCIGV